MPVETATRRLFSTAMPVAGASCSYMQTEVFSGQRGHGKLVALCLIALGALAIAVVAVEA